MTETKQSIRLKLAAIAVLLGVFVAGAVTGAQLYRWGERSSLPFPPPRMPPPMRFRALGLSAEQERQVDAIMRKHHPEVEAVLREGFPRLRAIHDRIDAEIRPLLTEEQRLKFDSMKSESPGRHERRMMDPMDGPPGFHRGPPRDMLAPEPPESASQPGAAAGARP